MRKLILSAATLSLLLSSCNKDEDTLKLDITGLQDLGANYQYEGWLIVDDEAKSAGTFTVDANGALSQTSFDIDHDIVEDASTYVLTVEPLPDNDPNPSAVHVLAGDFNGETGALTVNHSAALGTDFTDAMGKYILATPTDGGGDTDEKSGVWWLDPTTGPGAGLSLPELPEGWIYEGWAVVNGTPVSTGTFSSVTGTDDAAPYSGATAGPAFPGEDLLMNAPSGLSFPTDLSGQTVVISVEPVPDNSSAPFLLKPLVGNVAADAMDHTPYSMSNNAAASNPTGTVTR